MFDRIAVVDPGEPALRLVRAVRELDAEHGTRTPGLAPHIEAERRATFVRAADEAVQPAGTGRVDPHLDHAEPGRALRLSRADAVRVGWGSVAEDPAFAELCAGLGVTFVGPPPEAMRLLGAEIEAEDPAEEVGVPVAPWSRVSRTLRRIIEFTQAGGEVDVVVTGSDVGAQRYWAAPHRHPDGEFTAVGDVFSAEADPEREEALGEVAARFEAVHDIERARRVGSVHDVVPAAELRSCLATAAERGTERAGAT